MIEFKEKVDSGDISKEEKVDYLRKMMDGVKNGSISD